ncbi:MAG TPA: 30S ribosomal protein S13 [archaeon]|nr:30S ribosomal protein S13 [archaeon]
MAKDPKEERKQEKKPEKEKKLPEKKVRKLIEGVRGIVRIAHADVPGEKRLISALLHIRGIGKTLAYAIPVAAGIDRNQMIGALSEQDVAKLEEVVHNPGKFGIPTYMLNRRRELATGEDRHLVSSDLSFAIRTDIELMRRIKTYKGVRHGFGLPVRGQRTRSSFRGQGTVGVAKGEARAAAKTAAAPKPAAGAVPVAGAAPAAGAKAAAPAKKEEKK